MSRRIMDIDNDKVGELFSKANDNFEEVYATDAKQDSEIKSKATQADFNKLKARVDNLTQTPAGSTEGNAELLDIRVGADGKTYPTAGEAVRGQIASVRDTTTSNILNITGCSVIPYESGLIPLGSHSVGDIVDLESIESTAGWYHAIIDVEPFMPFGVNVQGGNNPRAYAFLDSDKRILSIAHSYARVNQLLVAPINSRYLILNTDEPTYLSYNGIPLTYVNNIVPRILGVASDTTIGKTKPGDMFVHTEGTLKLVTESNEQGIPTKEITYPFKRSLVSLATTNQLIDLSSESTVLASNTLYIKGVGKSNICDNPGDVYIDSESNELRLALGLATTDGFWRTIPVPYSESTLYIMNDKVHYYDFSKKTLVVINNYDDISELLGLKPESDWVNGSIIPLGKYSLGDTVDMTTENLANYSHMIIEVEAGARIAVSLEGGNNPRAYAFLDSNRKLLSVSSSYYSSLGAIIVAPINSKYLIINNNNTNHPDKYVYSGNYLPSVLNQVQDNNYNYIISSSDQALVALANGKLLADDMNNHLVDLKKPNDKMVHVSTFTIINDTIYATYYANTRSSAENPSEHTARFVHCSLTNPSDISYVDLQDVGETFDNKTVTAIYDTILLKKDDDELYLMWTASLDSNYCRLYRTYNLKSGELGSIQYNNFRIGSEVARFTASDMTSLLDSNGISHKLLSGDIGIMQKLTSKLCKNTLYYYTGCYVGPFNCIIRSTDLITWEYVSSPSFPNSSNWENACYVLGDYCYYAVRQYPAKNAGFLTRYNLLSGQWDLPVYYLDCQSRADFFEYNGNLYLIHAPVDRNHISLMKINTNCLASSYEIATALVDDCFYPFATTYNNEVYLSFTQSRQHLYISKLRLNFKSPKQVVEALTNIIN